MDQMVTQEDLPAILLDLQVILTVEGYHGQEYLKVMGILHRLLLLLLKMEVISSERSGNSRNS